jgi:hypothetical protein
MKNSAQTSIQIRNNEMTYFIQDDEMVSCTSIIGGGVIHTIIKMHPIIGLQLIAKRFYYPSRRDRGWRLYYPRYF